LIPDTFIQDLLLRISIEDVVGRYVQLRKGGANLLGLCPFHNEKTPSFTVSPTKQFYHCFGCGAHGSAIKFLMEHTGATFPEAVRSLAAEVGMTVPEAPRSARQRDADRRRKLEVSQHQQVLEIAQKHYLSQLKASRPAIDYLTRRGLSGEIAARFGLGWSGGGRRALATVMPDYESAVLVESGLVIEAEDGRRYDRFRDRIMFPIRNRRGHLVGFGGRLIRPGEPKYLNSPETTLFSKGHELYGLWESRTGIRQQGFVLVVEGYMDVVALAQHGLDNAVATLGTATTEFHIQQLMRSSSRIVFSFDGDRAGRQAAWRALNTCLPLLRDDVSIRFLFLPDQHDPDSYIQEHGVDAFRAEVDQAQALSTFMLGELARRHALDEPEGRAACIHEARPLLAMLPESAIRVQIEREFARQVLLTPEELGVMLADTARAGQQEGGAARGGGSGRRHEAGFVDHAAPDPGGDSWQSGQALPGDAGMPGYAEPASYDYDDAGFMPDHGYPPEQTNASIPRRSRGMRGRQGPYSGARPRMQQRAVTPMAKRLLRLLLAHPGLVEHLGDQQLEILDNSPHLVLVRDLITLANVSGARHAGALLEAADPDSDLADVLAPLTTELLGEEDLPDPLTEWNDALRRIELDAIKAEQSALVQSGLRDKASQQRYQELTRRRTLLERAPDSQVK